MLHKAILQTSTMTAEARGVWIKDNAVQTFTDTIREHFTEEVLAEKHKRSTDLTREIIKLTDTKKAIVDALSKGCDSEFDVTIPETNGIRNLTKERDALVRIVDKGYSEEEVEIFGIPHEDGFIYFFDAGGENYPERTKKMSIKERRAVFGMFAKMEDEEDDLRQAQ